jgi:hypothetical protein
VKTTSLLLCLCLTTLATAAPDVAQHLQDISVTIRTPAAEGSGVIKIRKVDGAPVNFVWTAAHVVSDLRYMEKVTGPDGTARSVTRFHDCGIVKELVQDGRRVGELKMDARVIRYSAAEDLALLQIRKKGFVSASATFYLDPNAPAIGTPLYHVGSMLGQAGANSMTSGIVSQIGRVLDDKTFDQTTVAAFPGCSGGGVYLQDGRYVGMVVRGAGETFILIVPVRRMVEWAKSAQVAWALDDSVPMPSAKELAALPIEDSGNALAVGPMNVRGFSYLIRVRPPEDVR